jgi:hypothetical protein
MESEISAINTQIKDYQNRVTTLEAEVHTEQEMLDKEIKFEKVLAYRVR